MPAPQEQRLCDSLVVRIFDISERQAAKDEKLAEGSPLLMVRFTNRDDRTEWLQTGETLA